MVAFLPLGRKGMVQEALRPGDTMMLGETIADINTATNYTITPAQASAAIISRRGQTAATTDVWPYGADYLSAVNGDGPPILTAGMSFRKRFVNNDAFDWNPGFNTSFGFFSAITASSATVVATGTWKDFLFIVQSNHRSVRVKGSWAVGTNTVFFDPISIGNFPLSVNGSDWIQFGVGSLCSALINAGRVVSMIYSGSTLIGVTISANAVLPVSAGTDISFTPYITYTQIGKGTST